MSNTMSNKEKAVRSESESKLELKIPTKIEDEKKITKEELKEELEELSLEELSKGTERMLTEEELGITSKDKILKIPEMSTEELDALLGFKNEKDKIETKETNPPKQEPKELILKEDLLWKVISNEEIDEKAKEIYKKRMSGEISFEEIDEIIKGVGLEPETSEAGEFMEKWDKTEAKRQITEKIIEGIKEKIEKVKKGEPLSSEDIKFLFRIKELILPKEETEKESEKPKKIIGDGFEKTIEEITQKPKGLGKEQEGVEKESEKPKKIIELSKKNIKKLEDLLLEEEEEEKRKKMISEYEKIIEEAMQELDGLEEEQRNDKEKLKELMETKKQLKKHKQMMEATKAIWEMSQKKKKEALDFSGTPNRILFIDYAKLMSKYFELEKKLRESKDYGVAMEKIGEIEEWDELKSGLDAMYGRKTAKGKGIELQALSEEVSKRISEWIDESYGKFREECDLSEVYYYQGKDERRKAINMNLHLSLNTLKNTIKEYLRRKYDTMAGKKEKDKGRNTLKEAFKKFEDYLVEDFNGPKSVYSEGKKFKEKLFE